MYEYFPEVKVGDRLTAEHVNRINEVCRAIVNANPGSFSFGHGLFRANLPPFEQRRAIVVAEDYELGQAKGIEGIYEIRFRFYNTLESVDEESSAWDSSSSSSSSSQSSLSSGSVADEPPEGWATDYDDVTHFLDMRESDITLSEGDKLTVYYDQQRGMYMPASAPSAGTDIVVGTVAGVYPAPPPGTPLPSDFGRTGSYVLVSLWAAPSQPITLAPGPVASSGSWSPSPSYTLQGAVLDSPDVPIDNSYILSSTQNDEIKFNIQDMSSAFVEAISCVVVMNWAWGSVPLGTAQADIRRPLLRIYESNLTTPLTDEVEMSVLGSEGTPRLAEVTLPITGATTKSAWDGAVLRISTGNRSVGTVIIYSFRVKLNDSSALSDPTSANIRPSGSQVPVYLRMGPANVGAWVYAVNMPWGYEALQVECR